MVSEYLTAYANRELYDIDSRAIGGYLGCSGRHIKRGDDRGIVGFKRIRILTGPAKGLEAMFAETDLRLVP